MVSAAVADDDGFGLAASFARYERYVAALGMKPASLDELLAGPPAVPAAGIVTITELCYSGPAAIERAMSLRAQVHAALTGTKADSTHVNDLLEEIFDLVQLGTGHKP